MIEGQNRQKDLFKNVKISIALVSKAVTGIIHYQPYTFREELNANKLNIAENAKAAKNQVAFIIYTTLTKAS